MSQLLLGIDLGTTSIKIVLIDATTNLIVQEAKADTKAHIQQPDAGKNEQNVMQIFKTVNSLLDTLQREHMQNVRYIGISGQMHGVVLWKKSQAWIRTENGFTLNSADVSTLVTWQDGRCTPDFLSTLPDCPEGGGVHTGFGVPTIFWMKQFEPEKLESFYHSGTIHDLLVSILTNNTDKTLMTPQNAASWGYFNAEAGAWCFEKLKEAGFPVDILPTIVDNGSIAGTLCREWHGIPPGTKIGTALGDMQASIYSILFDKPLDGSAFLNVSTSIQLAFVLPKEVSANVFSDFSGLEIREYFFGRSIVVAAALTGGNCLATFVQMLSSWIEVLGLEIDKDTIWNKLLTTNGNETESDLVVEPTFMGERNCPAKKASVSNIHSNNLQLGQVFRAVCRGISTNTETLMPQHVLEQYGVKTIYGTGSALLRNPILQEELKNVFHKFQIDICEGGDSAVGAALLGKLLVKD